VDLEGSKIGGGEKDLPEEEALNTPGLWYLQNLGPGYISMA